MKSTTDLREKYPWMSTPIYCENGCGAVIELAEGFVSYKRGSDGQRLLICECCASEEGHIHEDEETPETEPVCHCKAKQRTT